MKKRLTISKIIVVLVLATFVFTSIKQAIALKRINDNLLIEQKNLKQLKEDNEKLQAEVESAQSNYEYIEKLARERLRLIKDGEQVIESLEP